LIGVPYDEKSSFLRGTASAPPLIREALRSPAGNSWTEALHDLDAPSGLTDAGDLTLGTDATARSQIEDGIARVLADNCAPIALGGDHAVTYPIMRAIARKWPGLTLVLIDAHPDLYDEFDGDRYSHATPFARILEERLVRRLVMIGIRAANRHQREQAKRFGVETIDMRAWAAGERPQLEGPIYLSLDLDGIDPAFAPGVSHRDPGGLTVRDVLSLIGSLPSPFVGADVVEYNPVQDVNGATAAVAAKCVKEIAGRMLDA
jgi:agmatinase